MWDQAAAFSPILAGALSAMVLANSEALLINGNAAGVAIGLGLAAVWCFANNRYETFGISCLGVGLALKPHDLGFLLLYFLLADGIQRRYAIKSLLIAALISVPAILWVSHNASGWMHELNSNIVATSGRGDLNDPGPSSMGAHTLGMIVSLQSVVSVIRDEPAFYNPVTYLVLGPLILTWIILTLRKGFSRERMWLALAAISALSLLPVYHRIYDAKLLLLSVPACAMLWGERGLIGWLAVILNALAVFLTSDLPWVFFSVFLSHFRTTLPWLSGSLLNALVVFPAPIALLTMGIFYLWVYANASRA